MRATSTTATSVEDWAGVPPASDSSPGSEIRIYAAPSIGREISLSWSLARGGPYRIDVIDVAGRRVRELVRGAAEPGVVSTKLWDGRTDGGSLAAPGVYFARLTAGGAAEAVRVQMLR
jgi:hypothetical protein